MSDPNPAQAPDKDDKRTLLQRLVEFLHPRPETTDELIAPLAEAEDNAVIHTDSASCSSACCRWPR